jgi:hypothetical protein
MPAAGQNKAENKRLRGHRSGLPYGLSIAVSSLSQVLLLCAGGALLKMTRWILLLVLVAFTSSSALADGVDPVFKLLGGTHSTPILHDGTFTFTASNTTATTQTFLFDFVNWSGSTATSLTLSFLISPLNLLISVDAANPFFTQANVVPPSELGGLYVINFFGTDETHPGILSQVCTGPDFDADDCTGGGADFTLSIAGVPPGGFISGTGRLPEPSTGFSLLIGMAGIALAFSRLRRVSATA